MTHETKAGVSDEKDSGFRLQASGFSETQVLEEHMYTITHTNAIWIHRAEPMINFLMQDSWGRLGGSDMERNPLHVSMNEWCQIGKGGAPNRQRMLDCGNRECLWIVM